MKKPFVPAALAAVLSLPAAFASDGVQPRLPDTITVEGVAQNPEGIEYDKNDRTFLLSSLNAGPIIKVNPDGSWRPFTSGEGFPLSTAGLQIDYPRKRLLAAGFNGMELMDKDPATRGASWLRVYDLKTGKLTREVDLTPLASRAKALFANDIAVDEAGNIYVSDWYAGLIYKVNGDYEASVFWRNETGIPGGPNGLDFHPDGYLLVSVISVDDKGIYSAHGLVKVPLDHPDEAAVVQIEDPRFAGFDGMVITASGKVVGITNDGKSGGGNRLLELASDDGWRSARVVAAKAMTPGTTVAVTPEGGNYVIHQDFADNQRKTWTIENIRFQ